MNPVIANSALVNLNTSFKKIYDLPWVDKTKVTQAFNKFLRTAIEQRKIPSQEIVNELDACVAQNIKGVDAKTFQDVASIWINSLEKLFETNPAPSEILCHLKTSEPDSPIFTISLKALEHRFPQWAKQIREDKETVVFENLSNAALSEIVEGIENGKTLTSEQTAAITYVIDKRRSVIENSFFLRSSEPNAKRFPVPKDALLRHSPMLARALASKMSFKESEKGEIIFNNLSPEALSEIANFFITETADFSPGPFLEVLNFSEVWQCPLLKEARLQQMEEAVKFYNEIDLEKITREYNNVQHYPHHIGQPYLQKYHDAVEERASIRDALIEFLAFASQYKDVKTALLFVYCNSPFGSIYHYTKPEEFTFEELEGFEMAKFGDELHKLPIKFERKGSEYKVEIENTTPFVLHALIKLLKDDYQITHLTITCNDPVQAAHLAQLLRQYGKKSNLQSMTLKTDNEKALHIVARAAVENTSISNLALHLNGTITQGLQGMGAALKANPSLKVLDIQSQELSTEIVQELSDALSQNIPLETLILSKNRIDAEKIAVLASALKKNKNLKNLQLEGNDLGFDGIKALASALAVNRGLTQLNLAATQAEAASVVILGEALETNPTLEFLDLSKNDITSRGAHLLIHSLNKNTGLRRLSLLQSKVKKEDVEKLRPTLKVDLEQPKKES